MAWLKVHNTGSARRWRFDTAMNRDRSLDRLCRRICGGSDDARPTLVAFGAANACSSGFGYAPAPLKRLRHRLAAVHGAKVTLIDEYHTSQRCCVCHEQLEKVFGKRRPDDEKRSDLWGVRRCTNKKCERRKDVAQGYVHRDFNTAVNMLCIYFGLAKERKRPAAFRRS